MRCAIWYRFYNLKNVRNTHGGVPLLVKLQDSACHFTKSNTHPWGFFHVFKIVQMVPNRVNHLIIFIKKGRFLKLDAVFAQIRVYQIVQKNVLTWLLSITYENALKKNSVYTIYLYTQYVANKNILTLFNDLKEVF